MILWAAAVITLLVAAVPVTRERLTRFAALTGLSVTAANACQVIAHFARLRRRRLFDLTVAVPLACFTNDPFYLVLGWCAVSVFGDVRLSAPLLRGRDNANIYRQAWLLGLGGAVLVMGYLLTTRGETTALLTHAAVVIVVAVAVSYGARKTSAVPAPGESDDVARAEPAIGRWSARNLYLGGAAIVLSGALLTPGQSQPRELPEYSMPRPFSPERAAFTVVDEMAEPTCPWFDQLDDRCRYWLVNGEPFPQAAPYVIRKGGAPRAAPFVRRPDGKAVVYLDRETRRMTYENARGIRRLTGGLPDSEVPTPTFAGQNRYVALVKDGAQIIDAKSWATVRIPAAQKVHEMNGSGSVVTTASRILVLDRRGRRRMSLPLKKVRDDAPDDTYNLRPDGRRFVVIRGHDMRVETFDPRTGKRMSSVTPTFPGDDFIDVGLGWSKEGTFLVRGYDSGRVYHLDLETGRLWRRKK
ncbi:hypothetical protein [Nonomuraea sp. NPDC049480]|uniref:hypothetical protein n=1 Tax=Nonomuraea sp. NPDC049480 TaxID=3364353 RepID=UPI0037B243C3